MKLKNHIINEDDLIEKILPKIEERVKTKVVRSIICALEDQIYPSEETFKKEFIKRVKKAGKSKGKIFRTAKDLEVYLKNLGK